MKKIQFSLTAVARVSVALASFVRAPSYSPGPQTDAMVADWQRAKAYTQEYIDAAERKIVLTLLHQFPRSLSNVFVATK